MTISDLAHDEKVALVALIEAVALTERDLSETAEDEVGRLASALGDEAYRKLLDEAEWRFQGIDELKHFLRTISRQEARELIVGEVLQEAGAAPAFDPAESELLAWLAREWGVAIEVEHEHDET